jgi:hypothetical protein
VRVLRRFPGVLAALVVGTLSAQAPSPLFIYTHAAERSNYLANAVIWRDPGPLLPEQIRVGPPAAVPTALVDAASGKPVECRYERAGVELGGKTPKFSCQTPDGKSLRVKYYDGPSHGNREVFAEVVATRLLWALGFDTDPVFPAVIECLNCPADPWNGQGARQTRRYAAAYEPHYVGTLITSTKDPDQGWTFGELQKAIDSLPPGALRNRQRMHFDALSLAAVFIQHGDRKRSQQRLVCRGEIDPSKGDLHDVAGDESESAPIPVLFEHPNMKACVGDPVVTLQDVGATFGGAGQFTGRSAKIHLKSWAGKDIFGSGSSSRDGGSECRGNINVSGSAGADSGENPRISEAGREFLAAQFRRLTPEHVRALFETARVEQMGDEQQWQDASGKSHTGVDAWVAAFMEKVAQIDRRHCGA